MSSDNVTFSYPHRTTESDYRVPTPHRIVVPPPNLTASGLPDFTLSALKGSILTYNHRALVQQNALWEWTYEMRREAQMILPHLWLGPMTAAKNAAFLEKEGVTCIIAVRQKGAFESKLMNGALRKAGEKGIEHLTVDVSGNQELIQAFPTTSAHIYNHVTHMLKSRGELGRVLVFCESGNERSAGVVAAYLMDTHSDVDHIKAMQLCQAQRFCVNFEEGMKHLLQGYWDILCARRQVAAVSNDQSGIGATPSSSSGASAKRGLEREEDEDEDAMNEDDAERFGGRSFVPFVDEEL